MASQFCTILTIKYIVGVVCKEREILRVVFVWQQIHAERKRRLSKKEVELINRSCADQQHGKLFFFAQSPF